MYFFTNSICTHSFLKIKNYLSQTLYYILTFKRIRANPNQFSAICTIQEFNCYLLCTQTRPQREGKTTSVQPLEKGGFHRRTWRTIHCRLCIYCQGTGWGGGTVHCSPQSPGSSMMDSIVLVCVQILKHDSYRTVIYSVNHRLQTKSSSPKLSCILPELQHIITDPCRDGSWNPGLLFSVISKNYPNHYQIYLKKIVLCLKGLRERTTDFSDINFISKLCLCIAWHMLSLAAFFDIFGWLKKACCGLHTFWNWVPTKNIIHYKIMFSCFCAVYACELLKQFFLLFSL